jgi:Phospholipase_D-nuclease N-terminal
MIISCLLNRQHRHPRRAAVAEREEAALEFIFGLIVLALDIWAIVNVIGSSASTGSKILWILLIIILPVVGFIIWFFAGPRSRSRVA